VDADLPLRLAATRAGGAAFQLTDVVTAHREARRRLARAQLRQLDPQVDVPPGFQQAGADLEVSRCGNRQQQGGADCDEQAPHVGIVAETR
jgi:hypothetical protein